MSVLCRLPGRGKEHPAAHAHGEEDHIANKVQQDQPVEKRHDRIEPPVKDEEGQDRDAEDEEGVAGEAGEGCEQARQCGLRPERAKADQRDEARVAIGLADGEVDDAFRRDQAPAAEDEKDSGDDALQVKRFACGRQGGYDRSLDWLRRNSLTLNPFHSGSNVPFARP